MSPDTLYFAYGSNMAVSQKLVRTGAMREARVAVLHDYRLAFNARGSAGEVYANIMPAPSERVWGVLYRCTWAAMADLDAYEGVDSGNYLRSSVQVETTDGQRHSAEVYVAGEHFIIDPGRPRPEYLAVILNGARAQGLPADYIAHIESLANPRVD